MLIASATVRFFGVAILWVPIANAPRKTAAERLGDGPVVSKQIGDDGWPLDPNYPANRSGTSRKTS